MTTVAPTPLLRSNSARSATWSEAEALNHNISTFREYSNEETGLNETFIECCNEAPTVRIPCNNISRAQTFYQKVFPDLVIERANGRSATWGCSSTGNVGVFFLREASAKRSSYTHDPLVYLKVEDIDVIIERLIDAGGIVCSPKKLVMFCEEQVTATFIDSEGNHIGIFSSGVEVVDTEDYVEEFTVDMSVEDVYALFTEQEVHNATYGTSSLIESKMMGRFKSSIGSGITGLFVELEKNKFVLLGCRMRSWSHGHYARLSVELNPLSSTATSIRWVFYDVPAQFMDDQGDIVETFFPGALR